MKMRKEKERREGWPDNEGEHKKKKEKGKTEEGWQRGIKKRVKVEERRKERKRGDTRYGIRVEKTEVQESGWRRKERE